MNNEADIITTNRINERNSIACIEAGIYWGMALFSMMVLVCLIFIASMRQPTNRSIVIKMAKVINESVNDKENVQLYTPDSFVLIEKNIRQAVLVNDTNIKAVKRTIKPSKEMIPVNYTELLVPDVDAPVYLFIDNEGKTQVRICVEKEYNGRRNAGFVKVSQSIKGTKLQYEYNLEDEYINTKDEKYGKITPEEPEIEVNHELINVYGIKGLYYMKKGDKKIYYIYGRYPNRSPGFFLADENGEIVPGTLPVEI